MVDSEPDAVALFRPRIREKLTPFLDLDEDSDESEGLYAEALADGSFLVHTFQPFSAFEDDPDAGLQWLSQFGDALPDVHVDPRGLLFFPDTLEPAARSYDQVVATVEHDGVWIGGRATSFELGQMITGLQDQMMSALAAAIDAEAAVETTDDDAPEKEPRT